jgi:hypothetical protein
MNTDPDSGGMLQGLGQALGGFIAGIPDGVRSFFAGLGEGAGVSGVFDWIALLISIALLLSVVRSVRRGRVVGPFISGAIAIALLGWAVT